MTDIKELFTGIGIVIDEVIGEGSGTPNSIQKIVNSFEEEGIPMVKYDALPDNNSLKHFNSVNFILLDWNLNGVSPIPEATINDNIWFIQDLKKYCFAPIFIFSDEEPNDIIVKLEENKLYNRDRSNCIFVKSKSELDTAEKLFSEIETWLKSTPSVYVLKEWEKVVGKAKINMLWGLYSTNSSWPNIIMNSTKDDGSDLNSELIKLLQNNLSYRIISPEFDNKIVSTQIDGITKEEIRTILECERFIKNGLPDNPFAGDVYLIDNEYYINIRPDCDIIRDKKDLYLLRGTVVNEANINSNEEQSIIFDSGEFHEKINSCYVAFVKGKILEFKFRKLEIKKWSDIKNNRIGRLLPPYITKLQQKYSFYIQRQGIPAIPKEAIL